MLQNKNIICISSIDWDFIWQGHQEIMSALAANNNRIIFIENTGVRPPSIKDIPRLRKRIKNYRSGIKGIRKKTDNLYIFSPIILPFPYSRPARWINRLLLLLPLKRWMKIMDFEEPIIWTFLPTGITLDLIDRVNHKLLIYYCIDNFSVSSPAAKKIKKTEKKLLGRADLVFVTSKTLYDYCSKYSNRVTVFPFGVNISDFEETRISGTKMPQELKSMNPPIIGYIGGIHKWIDFGLVKSLAQNHPQYSFVFVGPLQTDVSMLSGIKNIRFLGNKSHKELSYLIKYFTVCTIPYLVNDYTKNVYPTKLNEYLIMGKPVVSTMLPEIIHFNQKYGNAVYMAGGDKEFGEAIEKAIKEDCEKSRERRIEIAHENSWKNRIEEMCGLSQDMIDQKMKEKELKWDKILLNWYHSTRRKFLRAAAVLVLIYLFLFYTPFIWFLAKPLKISDAPRKSDAIVVFAGGVGESGKAGQGYEERVQYAVKLYKEGYAEHLIFSSGYMYVYKEPLLMKALAISLGVPEEAILLEDKAKNTHENIKFTQQILKDNGWKKILLVSTPYHMRRASLVFDKIAKDTEVAYTPIPESFFYSHTTRDSEGKRKWKQINLSQIKGILHEYLGILYYYWKKII